MGVFSEHHRDREAGEEANLVIALLVALQHMIRDRENALSSSSFSASSN